MSRKNVLIAIGVVLIGAGVVAANLYFKKDKGLSVTTDTIKARDLEAIVSASGKIQPKRLVKISAETSGRVVNLAVNEGDRVKVGQFLLQIDPKSLRSRVEGNAASVESAEGALQQLRQSVETSRVQVEQAQQTLTRQRNLWAQQLTTRETLEKAENDLRSAQSALQEREKQSSRRRAGSTEGAARERALRPQWSRMESPIRGIVTRRNVNPRGRAVIGTMNNAGTVPNAGAGRHDDHQAEVEVDKPTCRTSRSASSPKSRSRDPRTDVPGHVSGSATARPGGQRRGRGRHATRRTSR